MNARLLQVLLVEDNPIDVRLVDVYLQQALGEDFNLVHAASLSAALQALKTAAFDVVLLDLILPDSAGLATVLAVLPAAGPIPIVVLSGADDEADAIEAVRQGAQDYLVKRQTNSERLLRAVRFAIERTSGPRPLPSPGSEGGQPELARLASLTPRELEVLEHLALGKTVKRIARESRTSYNTVKHQRASIMEKLGAASHGDLVRIAGLSPCRK